MQPLQASTIAQRLGALIAARYHGNWAEAARACGVSTTGLQKIKEGGDPRASTLGRIALGLGVSLDALVLGVDRVSSEDPAPYIVESRPGRPVPGPTDGERLATWQQATADVLAAMEVADMHWPPEVVTGLIGFAAEHELDREAVQVLVSLFAPVTARNNQQHATES